MTENTPRRENSERNIAYLQAIALLGMKIFVAQYFANLYPIPPDLMLQLQLMAGLAQTIGGVMDSTSTVKLYDEVRKSRAKGYNQPVSEGNKLLPREPTLKDVLDPRILAIQALDYIPTAIFPPYGFIRYSWSFFASRTNNESRKNVLENMRNPLP